ncbi:unnamed protein product [Ambrosiozyma monospora]|uniref:Unnamed protein product n=1 Tax=Ambrosiozyma monospora TaxID=43982 RepID=A0ACB5U4Y9_AMBMO|nr:unnamed protein product [Ambrosiozyma monospora]
MPLQPKNPNGKTRKHTKIQLEFEEPDSDDELFSTKRLKTQTDDATTPAKQAKTTNKFKFKKISKEKALRLKHEGEVHGESASTRPKVKKEVNQDLPRSTTSHFSDKNEIHTNPMKKENAEDENATLLPTFGKFLEPKGLSILEDLAVTESQNNSTPSTPNFSNESEDEDDLDIDRDW